MLSENIADLAVALSKAQSKIKSAIKDSANPFYKSKYADLHSVWDACREALNSNGLTVVQTIEFNQQAEAFTLTTTLLHTSGQWIKGACPLINGKADMQGLGSAISYARRYSIASMCGVVTEDDDANTADQIEKKFPKGNTFLSKNTDDSNTVSPSEYNSDYIIPLPKKTVKGKRLHEVPDYELLQYSDWIKREGIDKPDYLQFRRMVESYLKRKQGHKDYQEPPVGLDIPWPETKEVK